ncbi:hypothetical protein KGM_203134 [Danaus plexippus plexippus]|uniref:Uncharacterized protein n=1 Tax=Danaus plexippus plexippus TaxID=278856 RepID=A0A212EIY6_DANPL|nr:hypothetical protein KGM_203134 [Danaus plexippus plexippus]
MFICPNDFEYELGHIIIAQNGAGNGATSSAAATEDSSQTSLIRYEIYLLYIIACMLAGIAYMMWRKCKESYAQESYAHYMRRELQDWRQSQASRGIKLKQRFSSSTSDYMK